MKALIYLLITSIKNRILNLKKKPAMLVLYIVIAAYFIFLFVIMSGANIDSQEEIIFADIRMLYLILAGLAMIFTYSSALGGLSKGSTLFNMADVGLLFVSPVSPIKILFYGLVKTMGTTLITSVFILFQLGNVKANFDVNNVLLVSLFLLYFTIVFFTHILSMATYIYTNASSRRKTYIKATLLVFGLLILVVAFYQYNISDENILNALYQTMDNKVFQFIPIVGWSVMLFASIVEANLLWTIISIILFLISSFGMIYLFTKNQGDYYEDVLVSTEHVYDTMQKAKEGKTSLYMNKKAVNKDKAFRGGKGPSTLFFKDLLERSRTNKIPFMSTYTIIVTVAAGIFVYFVDDSFSGYIVLGILVYMQLFTVSLGPLAQELRKPYIYLMPGKSLNKLIYASLSSLIKPAIDAVIIFAVVSAVGRISIFLNMFLALAYAASSALFVSYTILMQRIFGAQPNKIVQGIVGVFIFMFLLMPGVIMSIMAISFLPASFEFLGTLPFTLTCIVFSVIVFIVCGNLIEKSEMNTGV